MRVIAERSSDSQPPARSRRAVLGGMLALALASCAKVIPPPREAPPPVRQPPRTGSLPDDQRRRVALLLPLSGGNAGVGQSIADAANLAILDAGNSNIRITTYDTALGAAAAAGRAISDGNGLVLGPLLADEVRAVAPVAARAGVPVIAFSNDTSVAGAGTYLLGFTPNGSIERVIAYAGAHNLKRFAGLMPSGLYGRRASVSLLKAAESAGGQVVAMADYDRSAQSLTAAIRKLGAPGSYDAVLIADSGRIALQAAPFVRKAGGPGVRLLGTELWNAEPGLGADPAMRGAWFASVSDAIYNQFAVKYRARFGRAPYRLASLGYDAVLLTIRVAADWGRGAPFPVERLADPGGFTGVDGVFRFGRDGIAQRALEVKRIGPGRPAVIDPAPRGF